MSTDVFISYASQDRPWAEKLARDLTNRGVRVFYDQRALRDGGKWEGDLDKAVREVSYLVCLWSQNAKDSPWVNREVADFRQSLNHKNLTEDGRLLVAPLDESKHAFSSRQMVPTAPLKTAYAGQGIGDVSSKDWIAFVDRIEKDVRSEPPTISVPVVILTLTAQMAAEIGATDRARIEKRLGIASSDLDSRYGPRQLDWKPFGDTSIESFLDEARGMINDRLQPKTLAWEFADETFWGGDTERAREMANRMYKARLGGILIDPVALVQSTVQARLGLFTNCLKCENVAIIALPPNAASSQATMFRDWVGEFASALLNSYVDPPLSPETLALARYGVGLDDIRELRRMLQTSVGHFIRETVSQAQPSTSFLR